MVELVICDLDDTLILERDFVASGFEACSEFLSKFGCARAEARAAMWEEFENSHAGVFDRISERFARDGETTKELVEIYRHHKPSLSYRDDARILIAECRRRNLKTAIITDGDSKTQHNKLDAVGAKTDFDAVIATADYGLDFKKPSTKAFELLNKRLGIAFENMLYVGDNPHKDFAMAARIPITTVRIRRKGMIHDYPDYRDGVREHFRVESLDEIFSLPLFK